MMTHRRHTLSSHMLEAKRGCSWRRFLAWKRRLRSIHLKSVTSRSANLRLKRWRLTKCSVSPTQRKRSKNATVKTRTHLLGLLFRLTIQIFWRLSLRTSILASRTLFKISICSSLWFIETTQRRVAESMWCALSMLLHMWLKIRLCGMFASSLIPS